MAIVKRGDKADQTENFPTSAPTGCDSEIAVQALDRLGSGAGRDQVTHRFTHAIDGREQAQCAIVSGIPRHAATVVSFSGGRHELCSPLLQTHPRVRIELPQDLVAHDIMDREPSTIEGIDELTRNQFDERGLHVDVGESGNTGGGDRETDDGHGLQSLANWFVKGFELPASSPAAARAYSRRNASGIPRVRASAASTRPAGVGP